MLNKLFILKYHNKKYINALNFAKAIIFYSKYLIDHNKRQNKWVNQVNSINLNKSIVGT